ncbi:Rv1733c family protein [Pseudonocardia sp. T1-2H]|uniref:Rv1733c family protein n=1 Tax=Pseudonocardia sp. T1-2H TaxID=3128899 RepID=UPI003101529A
MTQAEPPRRDPSKDRDPSRSARLPRRTTDRVEEVVALVVILLGMAAAVASVVLGVGTHGALLERVEYEAAHRSVVTAVLTADPPPASADRPAGAARAPAPARWTDASGREHTGLVPAPDGARAGSGVELWIGEDGEPAGRPMSADEATLVGWSAGVLALLCGLGLLRVLWGATVRCTASANDRNWTREWERVEPRWSGRRGHGADR